MTGGSAPGVGAVVVEALVRSGRVAATAVLGQAHRLLGVWRRSIQLRVVTTTLVVAAAVIAVLGMLLMNQISHGLVNTKRGQAVEEVQTGQSYAQQQLQTLGGTSDPALDNTLRTVVSNLSTRGVRAGRFAVVITTDNVRLPPLYVAQYEPERVDVPDRLARTIATDKTLAYQYVSTTLDAGEPRPFLVVGAPVESSAGRFVLYYYFPLDAEVATVDLVRKALLGTGLLLVILLACLAWVVTRQVVTPVRMAARTAERLSAGLLEERMRVHGEDDLARLAHSFNQMATNLQRQIVQLEDLSRLQRRFTSDVSHELRTPLTTIRMAADVLHASREDFTPAASRSAELLQTELDRFELLLADLLEISRYDGGFAVLEPEPVDIGRLVEKVVENLSTLAERNGVPVEMVLPTAPVLAEVDPRRVERVVRNLVGNALEYADGKPVRVTVASDGAACAVAVRDYGVGLKPGEAQAVFNRFWRSDPSRARHTGGTGLGLSIALEDARLHGGTLRAWGRPGRGAQFLLTLPLHAGDPLRSEPLGPVPADASAPPRASAALEHGA